MGNKCVEHTRTTHYGTNEWMNQDMQAIGLDFIQDFNTPQDTRKNSATFQTDALLVDNNLTLSWHKKELCLILGDTVFDLVGVENTSNRS